MKSVTWALRLVFAVVIFELVIVAGTVVKCFDTDSCDENDSNNITLILNSIAAKSFALYAAEKGSAVLLGRNGKMATHHIVGAAKSIIQSGALADYEDLSRSCGAAMLLHFMLYSHPGAAPPVDEAGAFSVALALHAAATWLQAVGCCRVFTPAMWWSSTCGLAHPRAHTCSLLSPTR